MLLAQPFSIPSYDVRVLIMYTPASIADPVPGEVQDDQSHTPEPTAIDGEEVVERIPGHAKKQEAAGGVQLGPGVPEKREIVDSVVEARGHMVELAPRSSCTRFLGAAQERRCSSPAGS